MRSPSPRVENRLQVPELRVYAHRERKECTTQCSVPRSTEAITVTSVISNVHVVNDEVCESKRYHG